MRKKTSNWNNLADWYKVYIGRDGSPYHQKIFHPIAEELLALKQGNKLLDVGCGIGHFAKVAKKHRVNYWGIDSSKKMIDVARQRFGNKFNKFQVGDSMNLSLDQRFDKILFMMSIQDMPKPEQAISSAAKLLEPGGTLAIVMLHPAFKIPRQSGWIFQEKRKLQSRRIDAYLRDFDVPMVTSKKNEAISRHYHRPISTYVNAIADSGLKIQQMIERPDTVKEINNDIPVVLGISASN